MSGLTPSLHPPAPTLSQLQRQVGVTKRSQVCARKNRKLHVNKWNNMRGAMEKSRNLHLLPTLIALANALFPSLPSLAAEARATGNEDAAVFYETPGAYSPELLIKMLDMMESKLPAHIGRSLIRVLKALQHRLGALVLCGHHCLSFRWPFVLTFAEMSVERRQCVLRGWAQSSFPLLTAVFRALKSVVGGVLVSTTTSDGQNRLWPGLKYPHPATVKPKLPPPNAMRRENIIRGGLLDFAAMGTSATPTAVKDALASKGLRVSGGPDGLIVDCDAVVLGSGAGGGTAAAVLSEAGMAVLVVEKGPFLSMERMTWVEDEAFQTAYEAQGLFTSNDGGVNIFAGASLGGGTRINWCASLKTPPHVRQEWSTPPHSLPDFCTAKFEASMNAVCQRLGVHQTVHQNAHGKSFKRGFEELGCHVDSMPRNCKSKTCSSFCCFGCASGDKQDGVNTYLLDAVEHGAKLLTGCRVETIVTENILKGFGTRSKRARGVKCSVGLAEGGRLTLSIRAGITITACGALHSPALLLRSGITCNKNVGKNLRLHPAVGVLGCFPENSDKGAIRIWEGAMMSAYSKEFAKWDSEDSNYGPLLSLAVAHPGLTLSVLPWYSAMEYKKMASLYKDAVVIVMLCRDQDAGTVSIDSDGNPVVSYWPSKRDRNTMIQGVEAGLRVLRAAGAERLLTTNASYREFIGGVMKPEPFDDEAFEKFLEGIRRNGIQKFRNPVFSAHQMGTCRMGYDPATSVADGNGETWEVENLFVCDASTFPTSSGVNPMITTQSISHMNASGIVARCDKKRVRKRHIVIQAEA